MKPKRKLNVWIKLLIGILIVIAVTGISVAVWYFSTVNSIRRVNTPEETIIWTGESQALLVYEPSNVDAIASATVNAKTAIASVLAEHEYTVTVNYPSPELDYDLSNYDIIVFGSPVYSGNLSPVLKEFIESNPVTLKHILLFVVGLYPEDDKELQIMESWIDENNTVKTIKISEDENDKLIAFVNQVLDEWEGIQ